MGNQAREATGHWCSRCWGTNCELHSHSPEQLCHISECKVEGKVEKAKKKKGCKHAFCSAGSSQQGLQVLLARRVNFDSEDQTDPAFPYNLPHSGHSFGPWSLCTPQI